ncbi:hypothetical protein G7B40_023835 [Aetokthonos hydrillicola Thurmond2011]|jgi:hypothetical protein|uniref:Uncharacterized protein n=1 Tax=Aetokthonos hydrillicola Thurmond2011 TaxID=2712845 RepID=A0AAP5MC39_9CYAN|nr:hypothetical protein [Aetokthonos hydrillicola]MBO3460218.1 hypothetical protein [Aetokthonos hydrillicola CCALA 1050]MBW4586951.1 hypothetical protein [Aetokthonos hydrillicola CCALA 1050]MDR9897574.1 hypothetical protein [Aetokthonos hydrillicola Thurmond2011]
MLALSRQFFITPFVVCFCILGLGLLQFPCMQKLLKSNTTASSETLAKEINSEKLRLNFLKKVPSFGYDNLMANWMYLSFIQYFGDDEIRDKTGYGLSPEYFEVILKRDPRFISAYLSLSTSTSIYAGMPERSINLMEDGLKLLSPWVPKKSYYIWRYKGIDELLFSGNSSAAKQSFATSADWASKHSDEESKQVAFFSQKTTEFLDRNPSLRKAQIAGWTMVLNNGVDEKTRHRAISKIEALGGKVLVNPDGTMTIRG